MEKARQRAQNPIVRTHGRSAICPNFPKMPRLAISLVINSVGQVFPSAIDAAQGRRWDVGMPLDFARMAIKRTDARIFRLSTSAWTKSYWDSRTGCKLKSLVALLLMNSGLLVVRFLLRVIENHVDMS